MSLVKKMLLAATVSSIVSFTIGYSIRKLLPLACHRAGTKVRDAISLYLYLRNLNVVKHDNIRNAFRDVQLPKISNKDSSHTHPQSAAWRSSAMTLAKLLCDTIPYTVYSYQASASDERNNIRYSRNFHWVKDTVVQPKQFKPTATDLVVAVDVDYYIDVERLLLDIDGPLLLYTFQPESVAEDSGEFSFRFDSDQTVQYALSGGNLFQHPVWNYSRDSISVAGFHVTKSYIIERRPANKHHQYILFIPTGVWKWLPALASYHWLSTNWLDQLRPVCGNYVAMDIKTKDSMVRSIAKFGEFNCANVPIKTLEAIETIAANSSVTIGNASVMSWLNNDKHASAIIVDYVRKKIGLRPPIIFPVENGARTYQLLDKLSDYEPDAKSLMKSFMSPILPISFVPAKTRANEQAAIDGRVNEPSAVAQQLTKGGVPKFVLDEMDNFVAIMFSELDNRRAPYDMDIVYERQHRPSQRAILNRADLGTSNELCETFLKPEPYLGLKDPRIITTYPGNVKAEYARYIYPLADWIMANCKWYTFGKNPKQIAMCVAEICKDAENVVLGDYSRMDGHICEPSRILEDKIFKAFFASEFLLEVQMLHKKQYGRTAVTKHAIKYFMNLIRGSGSGETAVFNTCTTKFNDFLGRRLAGLDIYESYHALGQFGGDDAIAVGISNINAGERYFIRAAGMLGQELEIDVVLRGFYGVNYLSRFYSEYVWFGDLSTTCDLPRMLSKIHLTPNLNFSPIDKLVQKLYGLYLSDRYTPLIYDLIVAAQRCGVVFEKVRPVQVISGWWSHYDEATNWPNSKVVDEAAFVDRVLPHADVTHFVTACAKATRLEDLLTLPIIISVDFAVSSTRLAVCEDHIIQPTIKPVVATVPVATLAAVPPLNSIASICMDRYLKHKCTRIACPYSHDYCADFLHNKCKRATCKFKHLSLPTSSKSCQSNSVARKRIAKN
jgi:hypothetical protein